MLDADYAMFQKGFSLGLMKDEKSKVEVLTYLTQKYPASSLVPNAIFERGRAYLVHGGLSRAVKQISILLSRTILRVLLRRRHGPAGASIL